MMGNAPERSLLDELCAHGTRKRGRRPAAGEVRLGRGHGLLRSAASVATLILALLAVDQGVGWYQSHRLEQKRLNDLRLEHAAFARLAVDLVKVAYEPDQRSFRLTMAMTNLDPGEPVYVMLNPVRVFAQSGLVWKEVPAHAVNDTRVVALTGSQVFETVFEPNLEDWTQLMPGYMHVRFEGHPLVSQRREPDDDIIERTDRNYVYLKPHGADDAAIRKAMKYRGEPPVYIPMPPH
jgi:hypothetical protein